MDQDERSQIASGQQMVIVWTVLVLISAAAWSLPLLFARGR